MGVSVVSNCAFISNPAFGGKGGNVEAGHPFGVGGGEGGKGGQAIGAGFYNGSNCVLVNCTFGGNAAVGGSGEAGRTAGNGGDAVGGGVANAGICQAINLTMSRNSALGGMGFTNEFGLKGTNGNGFGGSIFSTGSLQIVNSILDQGSSNNFHGWFTDLGHNISSDATPAWTSGTSLNNADALLLPLANNGGPTLTMALGAGSPALDSADCAIAPATDQRGHLRPSGGGCDIGAYEGSISLQPYLYIFRESSSTNVLRWMAEAGRSYRIEESVSLSAWTALATNVATTNGWLDFRVPAEASRFFRLLAQ
jgi:hypothetical protein